MYSGGMQLVCEPDVFISRGYCGDSDLGVWRKREKWKSASVRWAGDKPSGSRQDLMRGKRIVLISRCKAQNGRVFLSEKKMQARSRFAAAGTPSVGVAIESGSRKASGTESDEVCHVPAIDSEGLVEQLPLHVSSGIVLERLGTLYEGPNEDKYWTENRCGHQHPYPVGYMSTKTYKGVQFKQTIEEGPDGPIFLVGEVNGVSYEADSPTKAWSLALADSEFNSATRIHGRKHFGFDCPMVLGFLSQMDKAQPVKEGLVKSSISNVQSEDTRTAGKNDLEMISQFEGDAGLKDDDVYVVASGKGRHGPPPRMDQQVPSVEQFELLTRSRAPSLGAYGDSIRLRSVRVDDNFHQKVQLLSCQDTNHPATRGFFQQVTAGHSTKDSMITETLSNDEFLIRRKKMSRTSKPNALSATDVLKQGVSAVDTSLDSILRRMDEVAQSDGQKIISSNNFRNQKGSEKMMGRGTAEQGDSEQQSSMSKLFSSRAHRSRILVEDSAPKETRRGQTRSLANLLEEWNKGGRTQGLLNGKPQGAGERKIQPFLAPPVKVEKVPLPLEEKDEPDTETSFQIGLLDSTDEDVEGRVEEWNSGGEGQSAVLKEIQQLVVNHCVAQALRILRKLHSKGVHLDDDVYSMFFPFTFDDWQKEAVEQVQEKSVLVCAPGGAGKFSVAARCLYQALVQGERCLFVTPYETLAKDHFQQLQILFGSKNVILLSKVEHGRSRFPITVVSLETLVKDLREGTSSEGSGSNDYFEGLGLAVMDRFHTFGDADCGSLWEEAVILLDHKVKLVALSLPMKASHDIVSWISSMYRPCVSVSCESEPVLKSYYYCDTSGLHWIGNSDRRELLNSSWIHKSEDSLTVDDDSVKDFQLSIRVLLRSLQTEVFVPLAISFSSIEDCIASMKDAKEVIHGGHISPEEVLCIEERLQNFFKAHADIERFVNKDEVDCLLRGFSMYHDGQLPLWSDFVKGLVEDNLVKILFGTTAILCRTRLCVRTVALCSNSGKPDSLKSSESSSDFVQLLGKAGRRGLDSCGNVVLVGNNPSWQTEDAVIYSDSTLSISSHFEPSYSLLLNLLSKYTLLEVRQLVESNFGDYLAKKLLSQELKELEGKISDIKLQKEDLEASLFQKLNKINSTKLQDATIFTHVDVRVARSGPPGIDGILPGLLCAVLPGPSELLYVILCADNNFRLLPVCALDHVYTKEQRLDAVYENATGQILRAPPLPLREKWKISPGDYLAYISVGTAESARVVEVLIQYGVKCRSTEEEPNHREEIRSCKDLLSTLCHQQDVMLSSRDTLATKTWTTSEKLIEVLHKADAMESIPNDSTCATLKPLGVLTSKLHHVENELWYAMALSSSIVKPLTAPELAAICAALVFANPQIGSEGSGSKPGTLNKADIPLETPKRLQVALEKLENLRNKVEMLQGSNIPPLRLDGSPVAAVHALCRETPAHDPLDYPNWSSDWMVLLMQQTVKLLHVVDDVWGRSTYVLSALKGASALHNRARRAAYLLQKAIISGRYHGS